MGNNKSNIRDRMKSVHQSGTESAPLRTIEEPPAVKEEHAEAITETTEPRKKPKKQYVQSKHKVDIKDHPGRFVMRPGVDPDVYSIKPPQGSLGIYNREVDDFISSFSKDNQRNGGVAITKSQLIEIVFDVLHYDLAIAPIGYESHEELRQHLQSLFNK